MSINNKFILKSSNKMKLFGMGLIAAIVSFLIVSDNDVSWFKIMLLLLLAIGMVFYSVLSSRKDRKQGLQLRDLDHYSNDDAEFGLNDRASKYDEDDFV
ncbi:MAG: Ca2+/Na+ antiporter [Saprospiraceae bacterium]|jgi:Ca2+/Na+ antiporter